LIWGLGKAVLLA